jgi:hypothetical protein
MRRVYFLNQKEGEQKGREIRCVVNFLGTNFKKKRHSNRHGRREKQAIATQLHIYEKDSISNRVNGDIII